MAEHNMIQHLNAQQLPSLIEPGGEGAVFRAGLRIATRVVVAQEDGGRVGEEAGLKTSRG
jgi:hypothetical protein